MCVDSLSLPTSAVSWNVLPTSALPMLFVSSAASVSVCSLFCCGSLAMVDNTFLLSLLLILLYLIRTLISADLNIGGHCKFQPCYCLCVYVSEWSCMFLLVGCDKFFNSCILCRQVCWRRVWGAVHPGRSVCSQSEHAGWTGGSSAGESHSAGPKRGGG